MKEDIEELRANVERTEMAGLTFIATRAACARAALDYIAQLEQTSRAQRTNVTECNVAAAPAAGQAGLAKPDMRHPVQPLGPDEHGCIRFKRNAIVDYLATDKLNELAAMDFPQEDWEQLAQLIGYSLDGFGTLSYVTDETYDRAAAQLDAAPVAADTEQATIDTPPFRELLDEFAYWASERRAMGGDYGSADNEEVAEAALIEYIDSVKLAPLATPADAGAGQNDEQLRETDGYKLGWMEGMQEGAELATGGEKTAADVEAEFADLLPGSYYMDPPDGGSPSVLEQVSRMAEDAAQWRAHIASLGQSPAPVTASDANGKANAECLLEEVAQLRQVIAGFAGGARQAASGDEVEMFLRWCDQVKLPIDAPDGSFSMRAFRWAKVAWLYRAALDNHSEELLDMAGQSPAPMTAEPADLSASSLLKLWQRANAAATDTMPAPFQFAKLLLANAPAPADRDAILEDAALQCDAEKVHVQKWHPSSDGDEAYNAGCDDCAQAIRALKSMERAADAKGGEHE